VRSWLALGWKTFSLQRWLLLAGILLLLAAGLLQQLLLGNMGTFSLPGSEAITSSREGGFAHVLDSLLGFLVWPLLYTGYLYLALRAVRGEAASLRDLLAPFRHPLSVLGAYWLTTLVTIIGFVLLVIPGIAWGLKFMFSPLVATDKGMTTLDAMAESGALTVGHRWALLGLMIVIAFPYLLAGAVGYLSLVEGLVPWGWWLLVVYGVELLVRPWLSASLAAAYHDLDGVRQALRSRLLEA